MIEILYADADLVVVNKEAGRPVHPSPGYEENALTAELVKRFPEMACVGSAERPGVVHRLDVETSGVMVLAKSARAYRGLRAAFEGHAGVEKTYLAVLHGAPKARRGTVSAPLAKRADKRRMRVAEAGAPGALRAVTHWEVLARHGAVALVKFVIETGRTHQIRVHAAHLGHPIVGDRLYGDAAKDARLKVKPPRLLLHAVQLAFSHPVTGGRMEFAAEVPREIVFAG